MSLPYVPCSPTIFCFIIIRGHITMASCMGLYVHSVAFSRFQGVNKIHHSAITRQRDTRVTLPAAAAMSKPVALGCTVPSLFSQSQSSPCQIEAKPAPPRVFINRAPTQRATALNNFGRKRLRLVFSRSTRNVTAETVLRVGLILNTSKYHTSKYI